MFTNRASAEGQMSNVVRLSSPVDRTRLRDAQQRLDDPECPHQGEVATTRGRGLEGEPLGDARERG